MTIPNQIGPVNNGYEDVISCSHELQNWSLPTGRSLVSYPGYNFANYFLKS